jgi:hypothetical protein
MEYPVPFQGYNAETRSLSAISGTLTDYTQAIANWQLLQLRKKWIMIICMTDPACPALPFPAKHPWAPARSFPLGFDFEKLAAESPEMVSLDQMIRNDAQDPAYGVVPFADDVEGKSTQILTSAANFQMSQWIWRWNIILCLVNPSCPHVNIPAIKGKGRSDYPSLQVNINELMSLNQDPKRGVVIPISIASK